MGGGSDEAHGAALEVGKEDVLLRFVEAVDFVDEEDGGFVAKFLPSSGLFDFGANFGDIRFDAVEGLEAGAGALGDDGGESGFAGAGRAVEDEGRKAVGLDGATEKFSFGEDVLLTTNFGEIAGTHTGGEGLITRLRDVGGGSFVGEEVGHLWETFQNPESRIQTELGSFSALLS